MGNSDIPDVIMAMGIRFWTSTVNDHGIKDVNHCNTIINYLQGFLNDLKINCEDEVRNEEATCEEKKDPDISNLLKPITKLEEDHKNKVQIKFSKPMNANEILPITKEEAIDLIEEEDNDLYDDDNDKNDDDDDDEDHTDFYNDDDGIDNNDYPNIQDPNPDENDPLSQMIKKYMNVPEHVRKGETVNCDYCDSEYSSLANLRPHIVKSHSSKLPDFDKKYKTFECTFSDCDWTGYRLKQLKRHFREIHKLAISAGVRKKLFEKDRTCKECNKSFRNTELFRDHMYNHTIGLDKKPYSCEECKVSFSTTASKRKHDNKFHVGNGVSTLCPICGKEMSTLKELSKHRRKCQRKPNSVSGIKNTKVKEFKPRKCEHCEFIAYNMNSHNLHKYKEHDIGAVYCDICGHRSQTQSGMKLHKMKHNETNSVQCDECEKAFKSEWYLERHKRTVHTDDSEKPFKCGTCGKGFAYKTTYEGHMNMHLGLKPYTCHICGQGFQNYSNRHAHVKKVHNKHG